MTTISYVRPQEIRLRDTFAAAAAAADGQVYTLTLKNQSASPWVFYVYQQMPNQQSANVFSLAWFCSPFIIVPGNQIKFQWEIDYGFVWGALGTVSPGVIFYASGQIPANLTTNNTTTFTTQPGPYLTPPVQGQPQGSLVIADQSNVPNNVYTVGISMGNAGTFVTQAGPNLTHTFTPTRHTILLLARMFRSALF
jgi:rhizosphere induced protein